MGTCQPFEIELKTKRICSNDVAPRLKLNDANSSSLKNVSICERCEIECVQLHAAQHTLCVLSEPFIKQTFNVMLVLISVCGLIQSNDLHVLHIECENENR